MKSEAPRVGLVLGAGGVVGASWLIGALQALCEHTGWDPQTADCIVGTSAGSVVGSLCAAGHPVALMSAVVRGEDEAVAELEQQTDEHFRLGEETTYRPAFAAPPIGPGSWRLLVSTLRHPYRFPPAALLTGMLPRGVLRTDPIRHLVERFVPGPWPSHPAFYAVACDYASGRRVPFGRAGSPPARVGEAVAASCAIPGFYQPVRIDGRRYVDGGVCSTSNLDLAAGRDLDLVVCLNPMSSLAQVRSRRPGDVLAAALRDGSGRRLGHEARKLRAEGTPTVILQPTAGDLEVMGVNLMARQRRVQVLERARETTAGVLADLQARGEPLPGRSPAARRPLAA